MMDFITEIAAAVMVGLIAFTPGAGIYIAVPAGVAAGVSALLTVSFTVAGAFLPLLLVHFGYEQIIRIPFARRFLNRFSLQKHQGHLDKAGLLFILLALPWVGSWWIALAAKTTCFDTRKLFLAALISLILYSILFFILVELGLNAIQVIM